MFFFFFTLLNYAQARVRLPQPFIRCGYKMECAACCNFHFCSACSFLSANEKIRGSGTTRELAVYALIVCVIVITSCDCGNLW